MGAGIAETELSFDSEEISEARRPIKSKLRDGIGSARRRSGTGTTGVASVTRTISETETPLRPKEGLGTGEIRTGAGIEAVATTGVHAECEKSDMEVDIRGTKSSDAFLSKI